MFDFFITFQLYQITTQNILVMVLHYYFTCTFYLHLKMCKKCLLLFYLHAIPTLNCNNIIKTLKPFLHNEHITEHICRCVYVLAYIIILYYQSISLNLSEIRNITSKINQKILFLKTINYIILISSGVIIILQYYI